ncbi:hypothetical protein HK105_203487 [Polyrhizophydium stewartii]|uniref:Uncharacterized protein n=1 Tax=Polyrhizophydium stewartii TaxID=2732419 RepID=A0ABR4NC12_9FUNG
MPAERTLELFDEQFKEMWDGSPRECLLFKIEVLVTDPDRGVVASRLKTVCGCGYKAAVRTRGSPDDVRDWFLGGMDAGAWDVARQVGSTIVFQMTAAGVAGLQAELAAARSDKDKMLVGFERLRRIFAFIESPAGQPELAARLGIVSHEVRETSMSEVFVSFAALRKGADK